MVKSRKLQDLKPNKMVLERNLSQERLWVVSLSSMQLSRGEIFKYLFPVWVRVFGSARHDQWECSEIQLKHDLTQQTRIDVMTKIIQRKNYTLYSCKKTKCGATTVQHWISWPDAHCTEAIKLENSNKSYQYLIEWRQRAIKRSAIHKSWLVPADTLTLC